MSVCMLKLKLEVTFTLLLHCIPGPKKPTWIEMRSRGLCRDTGGIQARQKFKMKAKVDMTTARPRLIAEI
jgi:hypothetical protein